MSLIFSPDSTFSVRRRSSLRCSSDFNSDISARKRSICGNFDIDIGASMTSVVFVADFSSDEVLCLPPRTSRRGVVYLLYSENSISPKPSLIRVR